MMTTGQECRSSGGWALGESPSHWTVTALKRVLSEPLKYGATEPGDESDPDSPRYIRITDFDSDGGLRADTFVSLQEEIARHYYLRDGDVLFARSGATVGKTFLFRNYSGRACFAGYLIKASTARHKLTPEFLTYFTRSHAYDAWKDSIFTQATIQTLGPTNTRGSQSVYRRCRSNNASRCIWMRVARRLTRRWPPNAANSKPSMHYGSPSSNAPSHAAYQRASHWNLPAMLGWIRFRVAGNLFP